MQDVQIIAINPGSTSTKIGVFQNENPIFLKNINHEVEELEKFERITDQFQYRKDLIIHQLESAEINKEKVKAIVGRGGLLKPIESGVYIVNEKMKEDLRNNTRGEHASNLGALIADDLTKYLPYAKAYIANPIVVDELDDIARISGHPLFERVSIFHALNQKAVARNHAKTVQKKYEEMNLIVVHMGGGITIGAHHRGKVIDVNQGLDGEGPFSPQRSGTLPCGDLVRMSFSGKHSEKEMLKMITGEGGMFAYLGTTNAHDVELKAIAGDKKAEMIMDAMAYQIAKYIGAMYTVMFCEVDAILITGGLAHGKWFVNKVIDRVYKIAPVHIYPGEDEMKALASNGLRVVRGETEAKVYI